jgi:hypothetical protein
LNGQGEFCSYGCVGFDERVEGRELWQCGVKAGEGGDEGFRGDVADQQVLSEGTAAEAANGGVKAAAATQVCGKDAGWGIGGARVEMNADLNAPVCAEDFRDGICDAIGRCEADRVGERNLGNAAVDEQVTGVDDFPKAMEI